MSRNLFISNIADIFMTTKNVLPNGIEFPFVESVLCVKCQLIFLERYIMILLNLNGIYNLDLHGDTLCCFQEQMSVKKITLSLLALSLTSALFVLNNYIQGTWTILWWC